MNEPSSGGTTQSIELTGVAPIVAELIAQAREATDVEGLDAEGAGKFCGISRRQWYALHEKGLCPAPVDLGERSPRWLRSELLAWMQAGAPSRQRWYTMRDTKMRRIA